MPAYRQSNDYTTSIPPILFPYNHLYFSNGWSYGSIPDGLYTPTSGKYIGVLDPQEYREPTKSPYSDLEAGGDFGCGRRASMDAFWFDAFSANLGCDNYSKDEPCNVVISPAIYSIEIGGEVAAGKYSFEIPLCRERRPCTLLPIELGEMFRGLTGLKFSATVAGQPVRLFVDNIKLGWSNSTCAAGWERAGAT